MLLAFLLAAAVPLAVAPPVAGAGVTERVSVGNAGVQANNGSWGAAVSADGRYVAFQSVASNFVPFDTNGQWDVFVRDRRTGAMERVSVDTAGTQADDWSFGTALSADGRYVAFESTASNLVGGDTNATWDVFVHDRQTGATERVSVDGAGAQGNDESRRAALSADGRYVAFESAASNLVGGDTNATWDVFVHDRQTGATERVSVDGAGAQGNDSSGDPALSSGGRYVAFHSTASNLVAGDTNSADVFVHDRDTGATEPVSVNGLGALGNNNSWRPALSADGRYVAFDSAASNLASFDMNHSGDVFVHDRQTGATELASVDSAGTQANAYSGDVALSADGRYVAFQSNASNLVAGDTSTGWDVFVHDRQSGATERVSVDSAGVQANGESLRPALSADGRYVVFDSDASNLVAADTNAVSDVFLRDAADTTAPSITLTSPAEGSSSADPRPTFSGTAGTATGDSDTVTVTVYGGGSTAGAPVRALAVTRSAAGFYSVQAGTALEPGIYTAQAAQQDAAGNAGRSSANTFTIEADGDGVPDARDNCPSTPNADQADGNGNGIGDACDSALPPEVVTESGISPLTPSRPADADADGLLDHVDRCPRTPRGRFDADGDGCVGPYRVIDVVTGGTWIIRRGHVEVREAHVDGAPAGARVEVLCRRCRFRQRIVARGGRVRLTRMVGKRLLRGQSFAVRVTAPGMIGQLVTRTVRRSRRVPHRTVVPLPFAIVEQCLPVGSRTPAKRCDRTPPTGP